MVAQMHNIIKFLEKQTAGEMSCLVFGLIGVIGYMDYATGYEVGVTVFYLVPISLAAYFISQRAGIAASLWSVAAWIISDFLTGPSRWLAIQCWDGLARLIFFAVVALSLSALRRAYEIERQAARTDHLTATLNSRSFTDALSAELSRVKRYKHAFTVAYIDIDNFKTVNDRYGHTAGDELLRDVVHILKSQLRQTDVIARMGGDEFALLLPETEAQAAAATMEKVRNVFLSEISRVRGGEFVTLSIGVLTCVNPPSSVHDLIRMADELMYEVKRDGKNAIRHKVVSIRYVTEGLIEPIAEVRSPAS